MHGGLGVGWEETERRVGAARVRAYRMAGTRDTGRHPGRHPGRHTGRDGQTGHGRQDSGTAGGGLYLVLNRGA